VLWVDSYRHGQPGKVDHPTQKPEAVIEPLVWASSLRGEMVLDPFAGSGTTGVACIRNGRNFIGWEREPRYYEIARKRLEAAREQPDLFRERQAPVRQLALPTEAS
jgi:site-specific DNA-methyltransferase (adenine-specific)